MVIMDDIRKGNNGELMAVVYSGRGYGIGECINDM